MFPRLSALLLDMDGLMVDTEPLYKTAWQAATAELGYDLDDRLYATIVGRPLPDCERTLMEAFGESFPLEALRARWPGLWRDEVERVGIQMKPGLPELLAFADARGLRVAVATSTNADWASFTLTRVGLADRFDVVVTGDQIARLFEPFFTTKAAGTGLGMPLCQMIVEAHGGEIWAEPGAEGATIAFTLPAADEGRA